jgi:alpha/beta superfamily hydrolase
MVLAGQFLERPALVEAGGLVLEGLYHRGSRRPSLLVCPAPGAGGGMDAPAVAELAWAAARAGHASLRFNHRGVRASQGDPDPARALDDARAALAHLAATARPQVAIAGVAAGCATAAALALEARAALLLVGPDALPPAVEGLRALAVVPEQGSPVAVADLAAALGPHGRVEVVPGADPRWLAGLPALGRLAAAFLAAGPAR